MNKILKLRLEAIAVVGLLFWYSCSTFAAATRSGLVAGTIAPPFQIKDDAGRLRRLADWHGRPAVLFFFCGCGWCHECGTKWADILRNGVGSPSKTAAKPMVTIVVFAGDPEQTKSFAAETGLNRQDVVLLPDPTLKVTTGIYHAAFCPRVFVLNRSGKITYTNDHADDRPRQAPAVAIIAKTLTAVRRVAAQ